MSWDPLLTMGNRFTMILLDCKVLFMKSQFLRSISQMIFVHLRLKVLTHYCIVFVTKVLLGIPQKGTKTSIPSFEVVN